MSNGLSRIPDSVVPPDIATDAELSGHATDTTAVHGIPDTANLLETGDAPTAHAASHADGGSDEVTPAAIGAAGADSVFPLADPADVVIDTTTYDNTVTGVGKLTAVVGAPGSDSVPVLAWAYDGDAFPRVIFLNNPDDALLYVGDGTYDPYSQNHYISFDGAGWNVQPAVALGALHISSGAAATSDVDLVFAAGTGPVVTSPDGTQYRLTVGNDGTLSTTDLSLIVSDTFTRANETPLSLAETGQAYSAFSGTGLSVVSNQLAKVTAGTQGSTLDVGEDNVRVSWLVVANPQDSNNDLLLYRVTDASNYLGLRLNSGALIEVVAGVPTTLDTLSGGAPLDGETIEGTFDGGSVDITRDGVSGLSTTTSLLTGTSFGAQIGSLDPTALDLFTVRTL